MKRLTIAAFGALAVYAAQAQIYQWKGSDGKTTFSDKPPAGPVREQRTIGKGTAAPDTAGAPKSAAERDLEFRKRQLEGKEKAEKALKEQAAAADREENCRRAKQQLAALESGERIAVRDDKGEPHIIDDAQRQQETERTRKIVAESCP